MELTCQGQRVRAGFNVPGSGINDYVIFIGSDKPPMAPNMKDVWKGDGGQMGQMYRHHPQCASSCGMDS